MGKQNADEYGRRNSSEGSVLVRITPERIIGENDTAVLILLDNVCKTPFRCFL